MTLVQILELLAKLVEFGLVTVEPAIERVIADWKDNKITAEEADAIAEGKFSAMLVALADPEAESAALGAETERKLKEKFDVSDTPPANDKTPIQLGNDELAAMQAIADKRGISLKELLTQALGIK